MWKPFDFDSTKKYPIIANVYPGPQTEAVTYTFSPSGVPQQLAQLGFIVIQIGNRGGSPQRSQAYQGFSYFNLRDYGLADKKAGIEQLAARHKWIDIDRVGIYGHSGGGFMTAAAMMLPPYNEFFKVGVSRIRQPRQQHLQPELERAVPRPEGHREDADARRGVAQAGSRPRPATRRQRQWRRRERRGRSDAAAAASARRRIDRGDDTTTFQIHVPTNVELAPNLKGNLLLEHGRHGQQRPPGEHDPPGGRADQGEQAVRLHDAARASRTATAT